MNTIKTLTIGALLASTSMAQAGGLADEIVEAPVIVAEEPAPAGSSISPTYIVLGVLAALLIAAAVAEDDDDDDEEDNAPEEIALSDMRLKTDIAEIGTASNGLPLYTYQYIGHDAVFEGVMAQDVLAHTPEAVITMPGGFYAVNYDMLGLKLKKLD
ncbi:MAG: tail fiber domain-containing protein [Pseudomonadota bacterium]